MTQKNVFITGGSGGLGSAATEFLVDRGWRVFAADFDRDALRKMEGRENITPVFIDVMDRQSIEAACASVSEQVDGLDGVVNFAGILALGSMIEIDEATLRRVLEVNVLGTFRVNQVFFPLIQARLGKIINISSETGWQSGAPFNGAYAMSKHAIEAYSDSLRREMSLLGIHVVKIQPGPFKTEMVNSIESNFHKAIEDTGLFKDVLSRMKGLAVKESGKGHPPLELAAVIHRALTLSHPKAAYSVKPDPLRSLLEYLPTHWADVIFRKVLGG